MEEILTPPELREKLQADLPLPATERPWNNCGRAFYRMMIDAVPPVYIPGVAVVGCGEPTTTNAEGETVFLFFRAIGDTWQCRLSTAEEARNHPNPT